MEESDGKKKMGLGNFLSVGEVFGYYFRKKDPSRPRNVNLWLMHGINKIAILMFLVCLVIILYRRLA